MIFAQSGDAYAERAKGLANSRDRMKVYYKLNLRNLPSGLI